MICCYQGRIGDRHQSTASIQSIYKQSLTTIKATAYGNFYNGWRL